MKSLATLNVALVGALLLAIIAAVLLGEVPLTAPQYLEGISKPHSAAWEVLWSIRAPRAFAAVAVGAALGLAGAMLQGLLQNPLADPGVLGVSGCAALGAALVISIGGALAPGAIETAAILGAAVAGAALMTFAARFPEPEALILFGVALSSFSGAAVALVFNLSPSPVATADVLNWLLGSVENRSWADVAVVAAPLALALAIAVGAQRTLRALTLGQETAATLAVSLGRWKIALIFAAALCAGAATAVAGAIGFVGLAAPHLVRAVVRNDPGRLLVPSMLAGAGLLALADLATRVIPTAQELKLGVVTALIGAPVFALLAWRAAGSWRR